jgi:D-galactarolactone cycloisomerase
MSGTTIAQVELWHFAAPLPATFRPSWIPGFPQNENRATIIRITTEDGVEGWSAGPAVGKERAGLGQLIGPYLIGEDGTSIPTAQQRLREIGYLGWRNWWIEPAFWDIKGKVEGKPLCSMLGGEPRPVNLYASTGEVRSPQQRIDDAERRLAEGFRSIKLRVHGTEAEDEALVRAVGDAMRGRMKVGVDANQAWRVTAVADAPLWDLERAKRFSDVCADSGVAWLEEPLPMDAYDDLAELTAYSRVPIAGGELHTAGFPELAMMVARRCYSIFQPDAMFTGGVDQTFRLIQLIKRHGLRYTPHTWTNGVGLAVNLHLLAASGYADDKELEYPYDPPGWTPEGRDAMLAEPFVAKDGKLEVPRGPGLGVTIDKNALRKHGKRFFKMDRRRLAFFALRDRGLKAAREMDKTKSERLKGRS